MHAILTRPTTAANSEPEPQHDRPADVPEPMPPLPQREPGRHLRNGIIDDIEREDDRKGYEMEPEQALTALLLSEVRRGDRIAAAAGRTAPRPLAQMQACLDARSVR